MERMCRAIMVMVFVVTLVYAAELLLGPLYLIQPKDATDAPDKRSGVRLITDYGTGCQYLQRGGLTPRLDANGNHICE